MAMLTIIFLWFLIETRLERLTLSYNLFNLHDWSKRNVFVHGIWFNSSCSNLFNWCYMHPSLLHNKQQIFCQPFMSLCPTITNDCFQQCLHSDYSFHGLVVSAFIIVFRKLELFVVFISFNHIPDSKKIQTNATACCIAYI